MRRFYSAPSYRQIHCPRHPLVSSGPSTSRTCSLARIFPPKISSLHPSGAGPPDSICAVSIFIHSVCMCSFRFALLRLHDWQLALPSLHIVYTDTKNDAFLATSTSTIMTFAFSNSGARSQRKLEYRRRSSLRPASVATGSAVLARSCGLLNNRLDEVFEGWRIERVAALGELEGPCAPLAN